MCWLPQQLGSSYYAGQRAVLHVSSPDNGGHVAGQGSAGNIIAALCSFFIPGFGQLLQGRLVIAILQFCLATVLWFFLLGWIIHVWSILDAALWKPKSSMRAN